ncbi:hypothetical protein L1887_24163 [Cichorium endivia]|nr:hypothetical protein L1887_24163 [Cichorium endivia]
MESFPSCLKMEARLKESEEIEARLKTDTLPSPPPQRIRLLRRHLQSRSRFPSLSSPHSSLSLILSSPPSPSYSISLFAVSSFSDNFNQKT